VPEGSPGKHCTKKSSIACSVRANGLYLGGDATVALRRRDSFDSRCAGTIVLETKGGKRLAKGKFNFGWMPPSEGGLDRRDSVIDSTPKLKKATRNGRAIRAVVQPYDAFVTKTVFQTTSPSAG
jgi:hypothetical protein